jgi:maltose alpha-D-glucosyltransferase/alpha-amylase
VYGYQSVNVESQRRYDTSLLHWMREMIHLRKRYQVFGRGTMEFVKPANRKIFAFVREHEGETVLCAFNLSQHAQPVELDLRQFTGLTPVEMLGETPFPQITDAPYQLAFSPWGFYWFRLRRS